MRTVDVADITAAVAKMSMDANYYLSEDILVALKASEKKESSSLGKDILGKLIQNAGIARDEQMPICQDTGMAVFIVELGQDVHITGGSFVDAINAGVAKGYTEGYLRKSVASDPLFERKNTQDNTPAIIHIELVPGDQLKIMLSPKGFGSENKSALKMLVPADGVAGVKKFILETVKKAGSNPCPPMVVGVGIGGTMEKAAYLSKKALFRPITRHNSDERYAKLEAELMELIHQLGLGPQGLGGDTTALAVNVEYFPTHIAGLPVAVNISCHATRHAEVVL
ncbi:fumarate hydratase subunit alpha [Sporomusaceae bacterium BoRhaA]|uniref:fumarate hydratase n=1 Tax=Pelorhabdus rhamnosifermentans TaxID=2772457 RepID=UPI001C062E5A|nr:fumarate hydratase [Pelorhabdus rhamnosifermentans]MBU2699591.1 fumarate hydratase subunit alpha [Pelorhabdus rhamnosifermentans]